MGIQPAHFKTLAESFGSLESHPAFDTINGYPEITILENTPQKLTKIEAWHTDMTFRQKPPLGTVLKATICPPKGGDTLWSSMTNAFKSLSSVIRDFLSGLVAEHSFEQGFRESINEPGGRERLSNAIEENPPVQHPVVQIHPESGKKVLFVNSLFTTHILGMKARESRNLLKFLYEHITTPELTCRFHWRPHSIAIWDNRSTQHKPVNDYFPAHRRMERIVISG